jgi:CRISPR-associated protein Cmr1
MTRKELHVTLETVTPLLLHGADNKTPELRPPSFRGAMHYWWRAALGGVIGDKNLKALHELEGAVFGSTECGSPISLRLQALDIEKIKADLLPHKGKFISSGALVGSFELILTQPRCNDALVWDAACASLVLALTFGGVGQRSRRGYGALRVVDASEAKVKPFPTTKRGWETHVKKIGARAIDIAARFAIDYKTKPNRVRNLADYPCATDPGLIRLCDLQADTAIDAVIKFMEQVPKDDALGRIEAKRSGRTTKKRQASPLWVRPIQTGSSYGLLCTVLTSQFDGADYESVEKFLDRKFPGKDLTVRGWNLWPKQS